MKLPKTRKFIEKHCFRGISTLIGDAQPIECKECGKTGWLPCDIDHNKGCSVAMVLREIKAAEK